MISALKQVRSIESDTARPAKDSVTVPVTFEDRFGLKLRAEKGNSFEIEDLNEQKHFINNLQNFYYKNIIAPQSHYLTFLKIR